MKEKLKGLVCGILIGVIITATVANAATLYDVINQGIKIVVDGKKLNPTDANGKTVEPIIYNGTTYLPVRAIASALGKEVYWDGPNYTVYLGEMGGRLEYPSLLLTDAENIGKSFGKVETFTDNYGNRYTSALKKSYNGWYPENSIAEYILNYKYSRFKGYICVEKGENKDPNLIVKLIADGRVIYTSENITKTTKPIPIDINLTGCNHFEIQIAHGEGVYDTGTYVYLADCGFYQ